MIIDSEFLNQLSKDISTRLSSALPRATAAKEEVEKTTREILEASFRKLNLVTREEFDAQIEVLKQAELTIAELEKKISQLESSSDQ